MSALHVNHQRDETRTSGWAISSLFAGICNYIGFTIIGAVAAPIAGCIGKFDIENRRDHARMGRNWFTHPAVLPCHPEELKGI